eukprot:gene16898-24560_t
MALFLPQCDGLQAHLKDDIATDPRAIAYEEAVRSAAEAFDALMASVKRAAERGAGVRKPAKGTGKTVFPTRAERSARRMASAAARHAEALPRDSSSTNRTRAVRLRTAGAAGTAAAAWRDPNTRLAEVAQKWQARWLDERWTQHNRARAAGRKLKGKEFRKEAAEETQDRVNTRLAKEKAEALVAEVKQVAREFVLSRVARRPKQDT